jgi:hypothetical protein
MRLAQQLPINFQPGHPELVGKLISESPGTDPGPADLLLWIASWFFKFSLFN